MELGRVLDRDARRGYSFAIVEEDHGGRAIVGTSGVKSRPPSRALSVHGSRAVDGDIAQARAVNEGCVLGESAHSGHSQDRSAGKLESHVALQGNRAAKEGTRRNYNSASAPHRVNGGLDGGGIVGTAGGRVVGRGSDRNRLSGSA